MTRESRGHYRFGRRVVNHACLFAALLMALVALAAPLGAADDAPLERAVLEQVNAARRAEGLGPLAADPRLTDAARAYSCAMAREGFFDHTAPDGQTMGDRVRKAGVRYSVVGENIAKIESRDPAARAVAGWLRSPGHRENIMEPRFTHTGVGACRSGRAVYFTQLFLRPR